MKVGQHHFMKNDNTLPAFFSEYFISTLFQCFLTVQSGINRASLSKLKIYQR